MDIGLKLNKETNRDKPRSKKQNKTSSPGEYIVLRIWIRWKFNHKCFSRRSNMWLWKCACLWICNCTCRNMCLSLYIHTVCIRVTDLGEFVWCVCVCMYRTFRQPGLLLWREGSPQGLAFPGGPHRGRQVSGPPQCPAAACPVHYRWTVGMPDYPYLAAKSPRWRSLLEKWKL